MCKGDRHLLRAHLHLEVLSTGTNDIFMLRSLYWKDSLLKKFISFKIVYPRHISAETREVKCDPVKNFRTDDMVEVVTDFHAGAATFLISSVWVSKRILWPYAYDVQFDPGKSSTRWALKEKRNLLIYCLKGRRRRKKHFMCINNFKSFKTICE